MTPGTYKHINNTDVAMQVMSSKHSSDRKGWIVSVYWLNIVNPKFIFKLFMFLMPEFVKDEDVKNWLPW